MFQLIRNILTYFCLINKYLELLNKAGSQIKHFTRTLNVIYLSMEFLETNDQDSVTIGATPAMRPEGCAA